MHDDDMQEQSFQRYRCHMRTRNGMYAQLRPTIRTSCTVQQWPNCGAPHFQTIPPRCGS
ncbi:hypothetical protein [Xanthomonas oryzae]|uniref:hypothetical protein n=1 Tax=Xanthomonas oryzae TaxID=347 RepID=UPI002155C04B|nr:hypothetical protein [Xanthomonas oryzae]